MGKMVHNVWQQNCLSQPAWAPAIPDFPFTIFLLQMLTVFCVAQILHLLILKRIGCTTIVSQMLAGFILGKSVLGKYEAAHRIVLLPMNPEVNRCLAMFSYFLSLFIVAVKMDFTIMMKMGRKACAIGLLALFGSMFATIATRNLVSTSDKDPGLDFTSSYISVTSFPVVAILLRELGILNSEVGRITLSAVLSAEIVCVSVMIFNNSIAPTIRHPGRLIFAIFGMFTIISLLVFVIYVMRPLMRWIVKQTPPGKQVNETYVNLLVIFMLFGALWTNSGRQFVLLGAYVVGAAVLDGPPLGSTIVDKLDTLITGIFEPYLVASCTMSVDVSSIHLSQNVPHTIAAMAVSMVLSKIVICLLCGYFTKMSARDSITIAFLMSNKGYIDVVSYKWWYDLKHITADAYACMEIFCLVCATVFPIAVRQIYDPLKKYVSYQVRDIVHCKPNSDLRILPCIFRPEHVTSIIKFLEVSSPTMEGRSIVYPLQLRKLVGRSQSIFISHDMQNKKDFSRYYSQDMVSAFKRFEMNNSNVVSIHSYTAMSPLEAVPEDICTLALDKSTSLIILPFHRTYNYNGAIEHDDNQQRAVNNCILSRAPCSVGILIDRSQYHYSSATKRIPLLIDTTEVLYSVCVIFIGGQDDREALAYAKRMRLGMRVRLTVLRVIALGNEEGLSAHDVISLCDIKDTGNKDNRLTTYVEERVRDGADLVLKLRNMVKDYDLVVVGRRFNVDSPETAGLKQWSEIRELGILGDLLTSPDLNCKTTTLIVQQQQQHFKVD